MKWELAELLDEWELDYRRLVYVLSRLVRQSQRRQQIGVQTQFDSHHEKVRLAGNVILQQALKLASRRFEFDLWRKGVGVGCFDVGVELYPMHQSPTLENILAGYHLLTLLYLQCAQLVVE